MLERIERDEIENARAKRQGHEFGDVDRQVTEARHCAKHSFERDDGDQRDYRLSAPGCTRLWGALRGGQRFGFLAMAFRRARIDIDIDTDIDKGEFPL